MTYTDKIDEMVRDFCSIIPKSKSEVRQRIVESINQAVAEERKRVVREARQTLKKEDSDIVERVIASLDKPLTEKEKGQDE